MDYPRTLYNSAFGELSSTYIRCYCLYIINLHVHTFKLLNQMYVNCQIYNYLLITYILSYVVFFLSFPMLLIAW